MLSPSTAPSITSLVKLSSPQTATDCMPLIKESGAKYEEPTTKLELVSATMYGFGLIKFKLAINPESNNTVKLLPVGRFVYGSGRSH